MSQSRGAGEQGSRGDREASPLHLRTSAPLLPSAALAFGILAVSMSAIFVRWANAPATVMGFWRMVIAGFVMTIPVIKSVRKTPIVILREQSNREILYAGQEISRRYAARNDKQNSSLNTRPLSLAVIAGFFFSLNLAAWNVGALTTTAANVTLLGNLSVVWVPLASLWLFKRRLRAAFWLGLVCALIGVGIILGQDLLAHPALGIGDMFGIASSFVYAAYLLSIERARTGLSALVAWWISTIVSAIALLALSLALNAPLTGYPLASYAIFAIMALVVQIGGFLSLNFALGHLPAPIVSASLLAQPVLTALIAVPLLGQPLGIVQIVGGILVLTGIVIVHKSKV